MRGRVAFRILLPTLMLLAGCNPQRPLAGRETPAAQAGGTEQTPGPSRTAIPPLLTGRFQVVFSPHDRGDTFLVDTMTGRVWQLQERPDLKGAPSVWEHMDRLDTNADDYVFLQEHPEKVSRRY